MEFVQKLDILNTLIKINLIKCYILPITLTLKFEKMDDLTKDFFIEKYKEESGFYEIDDWKEIDNKTLEKIWKKIKKEKWNYVPFEDIKEMKFIGRKDFSILGFGNEYEKRQNDTDSYVIENENGLTIKDWVEGVYRCKADLHNYWNELFYEVNFKEGDTECEVEFNYGS